MVLRAWVRGGHEFIINLPCCVIFSSSTQHSGCKHRGQDCSFVVLLILVKSSTTHPVLQALDTAFSWIPRVYSVTKCYQFHPPNISNSCPLHQVYIPVISHLGYSTGFQHLSLSGNLLSSTHFAYCSLHEHFIMKMAQNKSSTMAFPSGTIFPSDVCLLVHCPSFSPLHITPFASPPSLLLWSYCLASSVKSMFQTEEEQGQGQNCACSMSLIPFQNVLFDNSLATSAYISLARIVLHKYNYLQGKLKKDVFHLVAWQPPIKSELCY